MKNYLIRRRAGSRDEAQGGDESAIEFSDEKGAKHLGAAAKIEDGN